MTITCTHIHTLQEKEKEKEREIFTIKSMKYELSLNYKLEAQKGNLCLGTNKK